jgi:hypothetical protein
VLISYEIIKNNAEHQPVCLGFHSGNPVQIADISSASYQLR